MLLPCAMIGGGPGSLIGQTHRDGLESSGGFHLVAGAFSRSQEKNRALAQQIGADDLHLYDDWRELLRAERERDGARLVVVATPDAMHFEMCRDALAQGFHVVCDKPVTRNLAEALELRDLAASEGRLFGVTFTYAAFPPLQRIIDEVRAGAIGACRHVEASFQFGWAAGPVEREPNHPMHSTSWRLKAAAGGGALADLGSHLWHYVIQVTGSMPSRVMAQLSRHVPGRDVNDAGTALLRFPDGATAVVDFALSLGGGEGFRMRVHGETGGFACHSRHPRRVLRYDVDGNASEESVVEEDTEGGVALTTNRPEAVGPECFTRLYARFASVLETGSPTDYRSYPSIEDGIDGLRIEEAVRGSDSGGRAVELPVLSSSPGDAAS